MTAASTAPTAPPPVFQRDFPGWLPPMLVKELRQGLRTRGFVGALVIFQLIMLILMLAALASQNATTPGARAAGSSATSGFFWTLIAVQLVLVTPSRALGGLQLEVDSRTLDLLMLTRLNAWGVVLGKWISLLAQAALLLVAMLPYLVVRYFTDDADVIADLGRCLTLFGFSAVLTAAGLWASGVAKVLRVVMVILLVFGMQGFMGAFGPRIFRGGAMSAGGLPFGSLLDSPLDLINAGLITAFFLVSAVRNIAPPAENHCFLARVLPLLALLPAPFMGLIGAGNLAQRQLFFGGGFTAFVLLFELAAARHPMASHWREWRGGGPFTWFAGRAALPGWPSAFLFGLVAAGAWALFALIVLPAGTVASRDFAEHAAWLGVLAFAAILFPAVMQSFVRAVPASPGLLYFAGLVVPGLLSGLAAWLAYQSKWRFTGLKDLMEFLPVSSFIFALGRTPQPVVTRLLQGMMVVVVVGAAFWQSRPYWQQLRLFEARDRAEPPRA